MLRGLAAEPGLAAPESGLAAPEPRLPAAVEPSATDPEPAGDAPASVTPFVGVPLLAVPHAGMLDALLGDVECARVVWISFDEVAFRSREQKRIPGKTFQYYMYGTSYHESTYCIGINIIL